jgi:hypothetical protein
MSQFAGQQGRLVVFNNVRQPVLQRDLKVIPADPLRIETANMSRGVYTAVITIGTEQTSKMFIIQR